MIDLHVYSQVLLNWTLTRETKAKYLVHIQVLTKYFKNRVKDFKVLFDSLEEFYGKKIVFHM